VKKFNKQWDTVITTTNESSPPTIKRDLSTSPDSDNAPKKKRKGKKKQEMKTRLINDYGHRNNETIKLYRRKSEAQGMDYEEFKSKMSENVVNFAQGQMTYEELNRLVTTFESN